MTARRGKILVSVTGWDPRHWIDAFHRHAPELAVVTNSHGAADPDIRYAVVWNQPSGVLSGLPSLQAIFSLGAGVDHVVGDPTLPDLPIIRIVATDLTKRMGEYVVWQALDHLRQGPAYRRQQANREWKELRQPAACAVTVGILGLGVLGTYAAERLAELGFRVVGWRRTSRPAGGIPCFHGRDELAPFLGQSDMIVVLLPLTGATRGIINAEFLSRLKTSTPLGGPVLINAGRGGLQVEADILDALACGRLMAASLDVFEKEPLDGNSALWHHPRVTVTPHAAASSDPQALVPEILAQMEAIEAGRQPSGLVDRDAGY